MSHTNIVRAFIVNGGTLHDRKTICSKIDKTEITAMMGRYEDPDHPNEIGILHACGHEIFENMNLFKLKQIIKEEVGDNILPADFLPPNLLNKDRYDPQKCYGTIQL